MTQTTKTSVTKIEIIWDRDHGIQNEGWYCRISLSDGQERDQSLDGSHRAGLRSLLPQARAEAKAWGLRIPRGVPVELCD